MNKYKKIFKYIILIIIGILFLYIGLNEDYIKVQKMQIILSLIKKIISCIVVIVSIIILIIDYKQIIKKSKIMEIILALLCSVVILISFEQVLYEYNIGKNFIDYPTEVLKYEHEGIEYKLEIENIDIEKEEENTFYKKTNYKMSLNSRIINRIVYICIERKFNLKKLKWETINREYYKDEELIKQ